MRSAIKNGRRASGGFSVRETSESSRSDVRRPKGVGRPGGVAATHDVGTDTRNVDRKIDAGKAGARDPCSQLKSKRTRPGRNGNLKGQLMNSIVPSRPGPGLPSMLMLHN